MAKFATKASGAIWWQILQLMQVAPSGGQNWNQSQSLCCRHVFLNIAGGTTDPEIDSVTWIKFGNNMALIANLATR